MAGRSFRVNTTKIQEIGCCHLLDCLIDQLGESLGKISKNPKFEHSSLNSFQVTAV